MLAAASGRLIVPIAHDAGYYWPRRGWFKKPGTIRVVIGPPIVAAGRDPRIRVIAREKGLEWFEPIPGGIEAVGGLDILKGWLGKRKLA